jgi:hypothetical protein
MIGFDIHFRLLKCGIIYGNKCFIVQGPYSRHSVFVVSRTLGEVLCNTLAYCNVGLILEL